MSSLDKSPRTQAEREGMLEAALHAYLAAILDIKETVASIGTDVSAACADRLNRLYNRLAFETNEKTLEESRSVLHAELVDLRNKLKEERLLAYIDPLTGVANRREFDRQLAAR